MTAEQRVEKLTNALEVIVQDLALTEECRHLAEKYIPNTLKELDGIRDFASQTIEEVEMSMFTAKHYEEIAKLVAGIESFQTRKAIADKFIVMFREDNSNFKAEKFAKASGLYWVTS